MFPKWIKKTIANKNLKKTFLPFFLFLSSFGLSFYKATAIHYGEDFRHSVATLKFVRTFSPNALMAQSVNGMEFLALPFYLIFGFDLFALRLAQSLFIGLAIVFFYFFSKNLLSSYKAALLTTLLLIAFPYFILMKYQEYPFLAFFSAGLLYFCFAAFKKKKNSRDIFLFGFLWGLGTYHKIMVFAFGFALLFSCLLIYRKEFTKKIIKLKKIIVLGVSFVLGSFPLIVWNIVPDHRFQTVDKIFSGTTSLKSDLLVNFQERLVHIKEIFISSPGRYTGEIEFFGLLLLGILFVTTLFLLIRKNKKGSVLILTVLFFTISSTLGINVLISKHLYMIIPVLIAIIALGINEIAESIFKKMGETVFVFFLALLVIMGSFNLFSILQTNNEYDYFTASYRLQYLLRKDSVKNIYALHPENYGSFWNSIYFTSGGKNIILASRVMEGENEVLVGTYDGNDVGCGGGDVVEKNFNELIETSELKNNIYVDVVYIHDDKTNKKRRSVRVRTASELAENDYEKIPLLSSVADKIYIIWAHESQNELIEDIKKIPDKEKTVSLFEDSIYDN